MCSSEAQGWDFINVFPPAQASGIHSRDCGSVDKGEARPSRRLCELPGPLLLTSGLPCLLGRQGRKSQRASTSALKSASGRCLGLPWRETRGRGSRAQRTVVLPIRTCGAGSASHAAWCRLERCGQPGCSVPRAGSPAHPGLPAQSRGIEKGAVRPGSPGGRCPCSSRGREQTRHLSLSLWTVGTAAAPPRAPTPRLPLRPQEQLVCVRVSERM